MVIREYKGRTRQESEHAKDLDGAAWVDPLLRYFEAMLRDRVLRHRVLRLGAPIRNGPGANRGDRRAPPRRGEADGICRPRPRPGSGGCPVLSRPLSPLFWGLIPK